MKPFRIALCGLLALAAILLASSYLQARFRQPNAEYHARRDKLRTSLDGPVVLFGYTSRQDTGEVAVFFQEENFYYLTGYSEPDAALLLIPDAPNGKPADGPAEILYLPPRDPRTAKWEGPKLGPEDSEVSDRTGFAAVRPFADLKANLVTLAKTYPNFYTLLPKGEENGYPHLSVWSDWVRAAVPNSSVRDATATLTAMREVKSDGELALLQKAIDASVDAQLDAMKTMHPGLYEYQVAARMKMIHEMEGCSREAYAPIVGTGFFSTVLHYDRLDNQINDGDVVVLDVGGEYGGYAADITRTLPANGKFTPRQREIYDIVYGAQSAVLDAIKPGAYVYGPPDSLQQIAYDYINSHGKDKNGKSLGPYYIHGIGHGLGLDVHDPTDYNKPLQAGMVITDEPGIYIPDENIGVRIEDDVLVTADGHKLLTARLPRSADDVENAMAAARVQRQTQ